MDNFWWAIIGCISGLGAILTMGGIFYMMHLEDKKNSISEDEKFDLRNE